MKKYKPTVEVIVPYIQMIQMIKKYQNEIGVEASRIEFKEPIPEELKELFSNYSHFSSPLLNDFLIESIKFFEEWKEKFKNDLENKYDIKY